MNRKRTKKSARSQGRKRAVVIPQNRELDGHADVIRALGRRSFDVIEIGRRLVRCRALLKAQRVWLAWIKAEFGWSRGHADNLIALYLNRHKLQKFSTLPVSALYLLARASPKLIAKLERHVAAGERLSLHDIQHQARAERTAVTLTSSEPSSPRQYITITAPPEEPTQRRTLTIVDFHYAEAVRFAEQLALFAHSLTGYEPADLVAAALPAEKRTTVIKDTDAIVSFLDELRRVLWESGKPRLVSDEGNDR